MLTLGKPICSNTLKKYIQGVQPLRMYFRASALPKSDAFFFFFFFFFYYFAGKHIDIGNHHQQFSSMNVKPFHKTRRLIVSEQRAFTLIELLVVIAIIALLMAIRGLP